MPVIEPISEVRPPPLPSEEWLPSVRRWRYWAHFLLIVPFPVILGLLGVMRNHEHKTALSSTVSGLLTNSAVNMAAFGLLFGLAVWASRSTRDDLLLRLRRPFTTVLLGVGYSVAIRIGILIVTVAALVVVAVSRQMTEAQIHEFAMTHKPNLSTLLDLKTQKNNPVYYWLTVTLISFVVAGLREELWRCAALVSLRKLWPRWFGLEVGGQIRAVVFTSILFGLGHATMGALAVGGTTVIGLMLGAIMVGHRSIWPAVIAHGAFDATTFAILPFVAEHLPKAH